VLYAGERRVVFVDAGEGRLEPRDVKVGLRSAGRVEIVSGLGENEVVVSSGVFLVASESRLRSPEHDHAR
jgi:Cu(I)/Ag(I) efflux system membrane fusion protein